MNCFDRCEEKEKRREEERKRRKREEKMKERMSIYLFASPSVCLSSKLSMLAVATVSIYLCLSSFMWSTSFINFQLESRSSYTII